MPYDSATNQYDDEAQFANSIKCLSSKQAWAIHDRRATRRCQSNKRNKTRWHDGERTDKLLSQAEINRLYDDTAEAEY